MLKQWDQPKLVKSVSYWKILNAVSLIIKGYWIPCKCSMDVSMNELGDKWVDGWTDRLMDAGKTYHTYSVPNTILSTLCL